MAEPIARQVDQLPDDGAPPQAHEFPGCRAAPIPDEELDDYEGRIEYWDARNQIAIVAEPATTYHEYGAQRFAACVKMIAMRRGSPIDVIGAADLVVRGESGERLRLLAADQVAYLHPSETRPSGPEIERGVNALPDVLLEVDYSTDVRRRKLGIYESWGFPEVWVEVPNASWHYRPKSRRSALTIYVLEGGRYIETPSSRAFRGWTAEAIHAALNEHEASLETVDTLRRVADTLAAAEGTGPDDDPLLRRERAEGRAEGRAKGRVEGRAEERLEIVRVAVQEALAARGLATTLALRSWFKQLDHVADPVPLIRLAWECRDAEDFLRRVRGPA